MTPRIGIVTVLYNSAGVLPEFFETLGTQRYTNFILYIVDNKSPDDSLAVARKLCASARFETVVIENEENYGVAKGNNIGIKAALRDGCDRVLLSNNDIVLVPAPTPPGRRLQSWLSCIPAPSRPVPPPRWPWTPPR